ncbi:MAG: primosomal protein N' [Holosporales bacterium]|jgi:primosomal protein N' (replication factor Y)|nr:primosomal protein N' [Holosporales bacterium]
MPNYNVAVLRDLNDSYSYSFDSNLEIGQLVIVSFRNKDVVGVVVDNAKASDFHGKIKKVEAILPYRIPKTYVKFAEFTARYNMSRIGSVFKLIVPFSIDSILSKERDIKSFRVANSIDVDLSDEQKSAVADIIKFKDGFKTILLHGITGSGKTEVFLEFVKNISRQILVLAPEVALSKDLAKKVSERLNIETSIWHNSISKTQKLSIWRKALDGKRIAVVGARSALFIPFSDLGAIIVDEEHDASFKQNETTIYNARDMAVYLGSILNIPVILSSATPSVESYNNAKSGKYEYVKLESRYFKNARLPTIIIDDLRKEKLKGSLSRLSIEKIDECLKLKKQTLIFVNRRGHTPKVLCKSCGWKITCPGCSSWLCYHYSSNQFVCHYCGYKTNVICSCKECGKNNLGGIGTGIEKVYEECKTLFPNARLLALSSDAVDTPNKIEKALNKIKNNEVDIILGTQIVAKGHNFNNLALVIVSCVDAMLFGEDFRATERAFQTIYQVAGRAGRTGESRSEVLIQTYNPNEELIKIIGENDIERLYEIEINNRKHLRVPPFGKMASIILSALSEKEVAEYARQLVVNAPKAAGIKIMGPIQPAMYKIRSRYRMRILVVSNRKLQNYINNWIFSKKVPNNIRLTIDIDPYDFV